jgi:hypothetical protein
MITTWRTLRLAIALALVALLAGSVGVGRVAARPIDEEHAKVSVVVVQASPTAADILTYTIKATNRGDGWAHYTTITVPFDAATLTLLDVQFSGTPAWVAVSEAGSFEIRTERLNSGGGTTTATLRFARQPGAATNAALAGRLSYAWQDDAGAATCRPTHHSHSTRSSTAKSPANTPSAATSSCLASRWYSGTRRRAGAPWQLR